MRDIALVAIMLVLLPLVLRSPYVGALGWSWLSFMNPQRLTYGFAYSLPLAQIVAITWIFSLLVSKEKRAFPVDGMIVIWVVYLVWMTVCTYFGFAGEFAWDYYVRVIKIQIMTFATMVCLLDIRRVRGLMWCVSLSIGFYTVKGGLFTLLTGGGYRVWGPMGTMFGENNQMAVATLMTIPLMLYLRTQSSERWVRTGLLVAIVLSVFSAVGSQSRGALVALAVFALYFWWLSKNKIWTGFAAIIVATSLLSFMPNSWQQRMSTIGEEAEAGSNPRLDSWRYSFNVASARLTGAGFNGYSKTYYARYGVPVVKGYVAHSIFFQALAETGWPGLAAFLGIISLTWRKLSRVISLSRDDPNLQEFVSLAKMIKLSLIAFMSGGAFLSLAFFDLAWLLFGVAHILDYLIRSGQGAKSWEEMQIHGTSAAEPKDTLVSVAETKAARLGPFGN